MKETLYTENSQNNIPILYPKYYIFRWFNVNNIDTMSRRPTIPLHKKRQDAFVDVLTDEESRVDPHYEMTAHLLLGTGIRNDTAGHLHFSWFTYRGDDLYLDIPDFDECRKDIDEARKADDNNNNLCSSCEDSENSGYTPKTQQSAGRRLPIINYWTNHATGKEEYFGLKDRVERYFTLPHASAPDGSQYGFEMIQADGKNGFAQGFANTAVRAVGAESDINPTLRKQRLINEGVSSSQIRDFGTDENGNRIPDLIAHDMRASFCTQTARNEIETAYAMEKTGHKLEETYYRYVRFARDELDKEKDKDLF